MLRTTYHFEDEQSKPVSSDVAMFLMSCEIMRLVTENTELKAEMQEILHKQLDRLNYENQIRDLLERLRQMQQYSSL